MNLYGKLFVSSALVMALSIPAYADNSTPALDKREANQKMRIEQGEKSGALTPKESEKLERNEAKLEKHEAVAKADGKVTPAERKRLNKEANKNSKKIHKKKHNAQTTTHP
jgi:tellurite resistance protein